jgi:hypothetical protein
LLTFIETMDFINKHNGSLWLQSIQSGLCFVNGFPDVFNPSEYSADTDKLGIKSTGHESSNGRFTDPWRAPQNTTVWLTRFKCQAKSQALTDQMLLANDFTQVLRAQALCQGLLQMNAGIHGRMTCTPAGALS